MIKVLLAEDHIILRDGIKSLLEDHPEISVVGEAGDGKQVQGMIEETGPDLLLVDINMPEMDGIETTRYVKENFKDIKVLILSMLDNERYVTKSLEAGADGYILKTTGRDELIHAIKTVSAGEPYLSHRISMKMVRSNRTVSHEENKVEVELSKRELEILSLIASGYTNTEIAEKTFTSKRTVETHRKNLIEKTGTKNTASLIKFAIMNGLLR